MGFTNDKDVSIGFTDTFSVSHNLRNDALSCMKAYIRATWLGFTLLAYTFCNSM